DGRAYCPRLRCTPGVGDPTRTMEFRRHCNGLCGGSDPSAGRGFDLFPVGNGIRRNSCLDLVWADGSTVPSRAQLRSRLGEDNHRGGSVKLKLAKLKSAGERIRRRLHEMLPNTRVANERNLLQSLARGVSRSLNFNQEEFRRRVFSFLDSMQV